MEINFVITTLLVLMIIGAIIAIELRDLLSSVVSVGAVGIILTLIFLLLQAPDLAIVQLVVEILALVIMIRATVLRDESVYSNKEFLNRFATIFGLFVFIYFAILAVKELPIFGFPKLKIGQYYINNAVNETGATNIVSSIILNYRAYDTLGEATILFTAITGVVTIMRKIGRSGKNF
jgi:multisubunit Na+/H+ antiporter MnhB subunit